MPVDLYSELPTIACRGELNGMERTYFQIEHRELRIYLNKVFKPVIAGKVGGVIDLGTSISFMLLV